MKNLFLIAIIICAIIPVSCKKNNTKAVIEGESSVSAEIAETAKPARIIPDKAPQFVIDSAASAPEDVYVGIGSARSATLNMARTTAISRAHADISRQLGGSEEITEYSEDGTIVTTRLTNVVLSGVSIIDEDMDENGNYWVVVMMPAGR